jgi:hypothetical protein
MADEKRSAPRVSYPCEVDCLGPGETALHLRIADVSQTGAFVDALTTLPTGTPLRLRFRLGSQVVTLDGVVCHEMRGVGMGVRFQNLSEAQVQDLERFVEARA